MGLKGRSCENAKKPKMESNWKVIYVSSRQEKKVALLLEKQGIEFYLPLIQTVRMWSDRKKKIEIPLFNGYVFVNPEHQQRDLILGLPGVVKYLRYNGEDAGISLKELQLIQTLISKGYDLDENVENVSFEKGEKVKIVSGPLKDYNGEILRMGMDNYAIIIFENFKQTLKVKLPKQILKKTDA